MEKEIDVVSVQRKYAGVGFIKSRKSEDKVMTMGEDMYAYAAGHGIKLIEIIADSSSGLDIDRPEVDRLTAWMEKDYIDAVLVKNIFQISRDTDDLCRFLRKAQELGVSVLSMEHNCKPVYIPWDGGDGC